MDEIFYERTIAQRFTTFSLKTLESANYDLMILKYPRAPQKVILSLFVPATAVNKTDGNVCNVADVRIHFPSLIYKDNKQVYKWFVVQK